MGEKSTPSKPKSEGIQAAIPADPVGIKGALPTARGLEGERRIVTILFCDVKGSTSLAEQLDPEEWAEIMNDAFQHLIAPVYRYGGTVARLMGDSILAFFGAPTAHEDDPQRAVLAGLDIVAAIGEYGHQIKDSSGLDFEVRVGINTGLVVVGEIGSDLRMEYTAMGDVVNLAARMEQTAEAGTVQISEDTYRLVASFFEVEELGEIEVKGKRQAVRGYRVLGKKTSPERVGSHLGVTTPLVGREREMKILREAISLVQQGRGQIVCLIGEAGIGKSRLINELCNAWFTGEGLPTAAEVHIPRDTSWRETRSISYAPNLPYGTFQQLIRRMCGGSAGDPQDVLREKIACECMTTDAPEEQCVRVSRAFEVLLGVENQTENLKLEGEAFKRELFEAMLVTWKDWARLEPTVLVFDDLHWADPASVELLSYLFQLVEEIPILFLCAFRPERESPSWDIKQMGDRDYPHRYTEINLPVLSTQESEALVNNLLTFTGLPAILRKNILAKAEGNPFFVEQIVQSLIETGVIVKDDHAGEQSWKVDAEVDDITIPDSVQALLTARIDRLDEEARQPLQKAAVIGRMFAYRLLSAITDEETGLDRHLRVLERFDLIREAARFPELEYTFRHALTQETAYKSILRKRRRLFHLQVAETTERLYPERQEEHAPLLAHHFSEAGDPRALDYYILAGDIAFRLSANVEAIAHYTRALEVAKKIRDFSRLLHIYKRRGRAMELTTRYEQALANYLEMENFAQERGDQQTLLAALLARAALLATPFHLSDPVLARSLLDQALAVAQQQGDRAAEAHILWNLLLMSRRSGNPGDGVAYGEQALAIARELDLRERLAYTLNDIHAAYLATGKFQQARESIEEARRIWQELDNKAMLADSYAGTVLLHYVAGEYDQAIQASEKALRISRSIDNLWGQAYSQFYIGSVYHNRGEPDKAISVMENCINLAEQAGFVIPLIYTRIELAVVNASLGAARSGLEYLRAARKFTDHLPPWLAPMLESQMVRVYLYDGRLDEAEARLQEIMRARESREIIYYIDEFMLLPQTELAIAKRDYREALALANQFMSSIEKNVYIYPPEMLYLKGKAHLRLGELGEAQGILEEALAESEKHLTRRVIWPILLALAEISVAAGNNARAQNLHQHAVDLIYFIADRAALAKPSLGTGEELRASFLRKPDVRAALSFEV